MIVKRDGESDVKLDDVLKLINSRNWMGEDEK